MHLSSRRPAVARRWLASSRVFDLARRGDKPKLAAKSAIHTLYISSLKALAVDIARNLATPIEEMRLPISLETRTGDTPPSRRARQRISPPDILLTTPERHHLRLARAAASRSEEERTSDDSVIGLDL
jgi:ATP-dependent helicase Lhr and Lhr-like helicase